jgi:RNA polymerase sigma-70 factor (ECF subfamily)
MTVIAAAREMHGEWASDDGHPAAGNSAAEPTRDQELKEALAEVRAGRRDAYERVVELCQSRLLSFAVSLLKDYAAAQELTQDAFVRAYRYLDRFDDRRPFYPWLATIAFRLAQDRWQRQRRDRELAQRYGAASEEGVVRDDPLRTVIADEESKRLWEAVQGLPGGERAAVLLFYRQELKIREAARLLGVSSGTVKTLLFRARRHLREALGAGTVGAPGRQT